jgi:hypothetical protein
VFDSLCALFAIVGGGKKLGRFGEDISILDRAIERFTTTADVLVCHATP